MTGDFCTLLQASPKTTVGLFFAKSSEASAYTKTKVRVAPPTMKTVRDD